MSACGHTRVACTLPSNQNGNSTDSASEADLQEKSARATKGFAEGTMNHVHMRWMRDDPLLAHRAVPHAVPWLHAKRECRADLPCATPGATNIGVVQFRPLMLQAAHALSEGTNVWATE